MTLGVGDSKVTIYLANVEEGKIDPLMDAIGDLLRDHGLANDTHDDDAVMRSLIVCHAQGFPDESEWHQVFGDAALVLIPSNERPDA